MEDNNIWYLDEDFLKWVEDEELTVNKTTNIGALTINKYTSKYGGSYLQVIETKTGDTVIFTNHILEELQILDENNIFFDFSWETKRMEKRKFHIQKNEEGKFNQVNEIGLGVWEPGKKAKKITKELYIINTYENHQILYNIRTANQKFGITGEIQAINKNLLSIAEEGRKYSLYNLETEKQTYKFNKPIISKSRGNKKVYIGEIDLGSTIFLVIMDKNGENLLYHDVAKNKTYNHPEWDSIDYFINSIEREKEKKKETLIKNADSYIRSLPPRKNKDD